MLYNVITFYKENVDILNIIKIIDEISKLS